MFLRLNPSWIRGGQSNLVSTVRETLQPLEEARTINEPE